MNSKMVTVIRVVFQYNDSTQENEKKNGDRNYHDGNKNHDGNKHSIINNKR